MWSDFWWFLINVISKYLFLEHFCQFSEGVLKFLSEAGDSIHSYSSCTHIGALKNECKCKISQKNAYLYTSNVGGNLNSIHASYVSCKCFCSWEPCKPSRAPPRQDPRVSRSTPTDTRHCASPGHTCPHTRHCCLAHRDTLSLSVSHNFSAKVLYQQPQLKFWFWLYGIWDTCVSFALMQIWGKIV